MRPAGRAKQNWRSRLSDVLVTKAGLNLPILRTSSPVTSVQLRGTRITDGDMHLLKDFKHLMALHLTEMQVTDNGFGSLTGLNHLTRLQLYKTAVTDVVRVKVLDVDLQRRCIAVLFVTTFWTFLREFSSDFPIRHCALKCEPWP